jgi:hypothetical protein
MKTAWRICAASCALVILGGCINAPRTETATHSASYVGDRMHVTFDEVVVTVRMAGRGDVPVNLHVGLGAIVNPTKLTTANPYDVADIVRRLEPRIDSVLVRLLSDRGKLSEQEWRALQQEIVTRAQDAFNDSFSKWTKASHYEVEIVITSFYLTDLSVGRMQQPRRWGW